MNSESAIQSVTSSSMKTTILDPTTFQDGKNTLYDDYQSIDSLTPNSKVEVK